MSADSVRVALRFWQAAEASDDSVADLLARICGDADLSA